MQDKLMPVLRAADVESVRAFYTEVLGFEAGSAPEDGSGAFAVYTYGSSHIAVVGAEGLPALPDGPAGPAMVIIEVADATGIHGVISSRADEGVGDLQEGWWGAFFDATDPLGNVFRFLQKSAQIAYASDASDA